MDAINPIFRNRRESGRICLPYSVSESSYLPINSCFRRYLNSIAFCATKDVEIEMVLPPLSSIFDFNLVKVFYIFQIRIDDIE